MVHAQQGPVARGGRPLAVRGHCKRIAGRGGRPGSGWPTGCRRSSRRQSQTRTSPFSRDPDPRAAGGPRCRVRRSGLRLKGEYPVKRLPHLPIHVGGVSYELEAAMSAFGELPAVGGTVTLVTLEMRDRLDGIITGLPAALAAAGGRMVAAGRTRPWRMPSAPCRPSATSLWTPTARQPPRTRLPRPGHRGPKPGHPKRSSGRPCARSASVRPFDPPIRAAAARCGGAPVLSPGPTERHPRTERISPSRPS